MLFKVNLHKESLMEQRPGHRLGINIKGGHPIKRYLKITMGGNEFKEMASYILHNQEVGTVINKPSKSSDLHLKI